MEPLDKGDYPVMGRGLNSWARVANGGLRTRNDIDGKRYELTASILGGFNLMALEDAQMWVIPSTDNESYAMDLAVEIIKGL